MSGTATGDVKRDPRSLHYSSYNPIEALYNPYEKPSRNPYITPYNPNHFEGQHGLVLPSLQLDAHLRELFEKILVLTGV